MSEAPNFVTIKKQLPQMNMTSMQGNYGTNHAEIMPLQKIDMAEMINYGSPRSLVELPNTCVQMLKPQNPVGDKRQEAHFAATPDSMYSDIEKILPTLAQATNIKDLEDQQGPGGRSRIQERRAHRRVAAAAAACQRTTGRHEGNVDMATLLQKERRLKNRASVEKCRERKRERLDCLVRERMELCEENRRLKLALRNYDISQTEQEREVTL